MNLNYFHDLFTDLEQQLWRYRPYWQFQPMQQAALPEPFAFLPPEFANELQQLDFAECAQLDADDNALGERFSKYFAHWQCPQLRRHFGSRLVFPVVNGSKFANLPGLLAKKSCQCWNGVQGKAILVECSPDNLATRCTV